METFRHVLYVEREVEGSSRGLFFAARLAAMHGARLTVAAAVGAGPGRSAMGSAAERAWQARLQDLVAGAGSGAASPRVRMLHGELPQAVARRVARDGHDIVLRSAGVRDGWRASRLDATDRQLLRLCPCPVWIMHPAQGAELRVVLAALDIGQGRVSPLDRTILSTAVGVAAAAGAELRVVHAWSLVCESVVASPTRGVDSPRLERLLASCRRERRKRVLHLLSMEAPMVRASVLLPRGDPVHAIRAEAHRQEADVVVVGNAARTGLRRFLLGNVPERIIGRVPGSVLSIRGDHSAEEPVARSRSGDQAFAGADPAARL